MSTRPATPTPTACSRRSATRRSQHTTRSRRFAPARCRSSARRAGGRPARRCGSRGSSAASAGTAARAAGSPGRSTARTTGSRPSSAWSPASPARPAARISCSRPDCSARSARPSRWRPAPTSPSARRPRWRRPTSRASARRCSPTPRRRRRSSRSTTSSRGSPSRRPTSLVERIAEDPEKLFAAIATEELGSASAERGDPIEAALAGGISTALGAIIPVLPFFFLSGTAGVIVAAAVSLVAHFAVGAAKSLFTLRSAWSAGLEMTLAGFIVGGATYLLGLGIGT